MTRTHPVLASYTAPNMRQELLNITEEAYQYSRNAIPYFGDVLLQA